MTAAWKMVIAVTATNPITDAATPSKNELNSSIATNLSK